MKITAINKTAKGRCSVYLDEHYFDVFDPAILDLFGLKQHMEVTDETLLEAQQVQRLRIAKDRAFLLLSYRDHSEQELYDKLCQKTSEQAAAETVEKMRELGFVDDVQYAQKLAVCFLEQKLWGYRKSLFEMCRKGVSNEIATQALDNLAVCPQDQISTILQRKYANRNLHDFKERKKVGDALVRLGFAYEDIRMAIATCLEEDG